MSLENNIHATKYHVMAKRGEKQEEEDERNESQQKMVGTVGTISHFKYGYSYAICCYKNWL